MFYLRKQTERGHANFGWLDSKHSFSFGQYYDPKHMGVSVLRVINDDTVIAGAGFGSHSHRDMEIISYVLEGAIEHKDSLGQQFVVSAGEIQRMSAGSGITHSEYNASKSAPLHFLQIWIAPDKKGIQPSYQQTAVIQQGPLTALVTPDGRDGSLSMQQDASIHRLQLPAGHTYQLDTQHRPGYLHIISGNTQVNDYCLTAGDALAAIQEKLSVRATTELTALWFDLPNMDA